MKRFLILKTMQVDEAPAEIQLSPLGEFKDSEGRPFRVTEEDVQAIIGNAAAKVNDAVIDYEHQTLAGTEAPAAGWVKEYIDKGKDGLWGVVEWTGRAQEYLRNKEYRYLSPVLLSKKKDADGFWRPSIFHSAGLTNTPQIDGMVPIVNKLELTNEKGEEEMLEKLIKALKLAEGATEEDVLKAVEALQAKDGEAEAAALANKGAVPKELIEALGLQDGTSVSEAKATILAMKQPGSVVSPEEFRKLKEDLAKRNRDELVAHAMKEGKITAAQKEWAEAYALGDPDGFRIFVNKAPKVVPMDALPGGGARKEGDPDEAQKLVNKALGISDETFKKYNAGH
ncbi:MAG: hypothetical protein HS130_07640 [Deltaproteobacteria bacterium]|nr:hypothetical protein [Deltaproteobacteria bacterium]MCL4873116.1 hypothetical protein [bacterium]